jgi:hypothetical protein
MGTCLLTKSTVRITCVRDYWVFGLCATSDIVNNTTFRKLDRFPSSGERAEASIMLRQLKIQFHCVSSEYQTMDEAQCSVIPSVIHHRHNRLEFLWLLIILKYMQYINIQYVYSFNYSSSLTTVPYLRRSMHLTQFYLRYTFNCLMYNLK